ELRMWLRTPLGEYVMLLPHGGFVKQWDTTLNNLGDQAKCSIFQRWPADASRPPWWHEQAPDEWPTSSSGRPSMELKRGQQEVGEEGVKRLRLSSPADDKASQPTSVEGLQAVAPELRTTDRHRQAWSLHADMKKQWKQSKARTS
ncbi:hypothetical protein FRC10_006672, partial [Ceratobasidium sp. 414]